VFTTDFILEFAQKAFQLDSVRPARLAKSLTFVVTTAILLYYMIKSYTKRLMAGQTYYKVLYESSPVSILLADPQTGALIQANHTAQMAFGGPLDALLQKNVNDLFFPHAGQKANALLKAGNSTLIDQGIWRFIHFDNTQYFANCYCSQIEIEDKAMIMIGMVDVTELVKAQQKADSYSHMLGEMQEKISDAYMVVSKDSKVVAVNTAYSTMMGVTKEYLLGKVIWDLFPNARQTQVYANFLRVINEQVNVHYEEYYAPRDKWFSGSLYPAPEGMVAYLRDITREKKDSARIEESDRNLHAVISNTSDAVWYVNNNYEVVFKNAAFDRVRAELLSDEEIQKNQKLGLNTLPVDFAKLLAGKYMQGLKGERVQFPITINYKNGYEATFEVLINPVRDQIGDVIGIGCFGRNITERVQAENQIRSKNERLRNIAWYQSHEVRGPVASILGLIKIFNAENLQDPENAMVIQNLKTVAEKLDAAVKSIVNETSENS
jgi:PAS domain S-box-containing protein